MNAKRLTAKVVGTRAALADVQHVDGGSRVLGEHNAAVTLRALPHVGRPLMIRGFRPSLRSVLLGHAGGRRRQQGAE